MRKLWAELKQVLPEDGGAKPRVVQLWAQGDAPGTAGLRAWYRDIQPLR